MLQDSGRDDVGQRCEMTKMPRLLNKNWRNKSVIGTAGRIELFTCVWQRVEGGSFLQEKRFSLDLGPDFQNFCQTFSKVLPMSDN